MSLGTGAFSGIARRYPWQPCKREPPVHANTNWHCHTKGIAQPQKGREGLRLSQNLQRFALTPDPQRSAQNASMKCIASHKVSKGPCVHPTDLIRLRGRTQTTLARNLTLLKLHLATFKLIANR